MIVGAPDRWPKFIKSEGEKSREGLDGITESKVTSLNCREVNRRVGRQSRDIA